MNEISKVTLDSTDLLTDFTTKIRSNNTRPSKSTSSLKEIWSKRGITDADIDKRVFVPLLHVTLSASKKDMLCLRYGKLRTECPSLFSLVETFSN